MIIKTFGENSATGRRGMLEMHDGKRRSGNEERGNTRRFKRETF